MNVPSVSKPDFWKAFNKEKKKDYDRTEKALKMLFFENKIKMLDEINTIIDRYAKLGEKKRG